MKKMEVYQRLNELLNTQYKSDDEIRWDYISIRQKLSEGFIREFRDRVNWFWISFSQKLSEGFIREFRDRVEWRNICVYQKLSEGFIREFRDRVNWDYISFYQKLSEGFIREFRDRVDWECISKYQKLSEGFIKEFRDRVDWECISKYQKLSKIFRLRFLRKVNKMNIRDSWHYKNTKFKKQQVIDTGLYECHDDYFIAYKGIKSDRYSRFNFQYRYLTGQTYESWCDCTKEENSFGLSVWTEDKAREYCDELVVKCKIKYEDVGRVVYDGGKIRCFKIEIMD